MKILVTGATGFIGRHVVSQLVASGHDVTAVARQAQGFTNMPWRQHARCLAVDIHTQRSDFMQAFGKPETLLHLAWPGLPNYREAFHFERNLPADYIFLKQAAAAGVAQIVVTGTCFEYGLQSGALDEGLNTNPVTAYGFAKDALRRQLEFLKTQMPFSLTWGRLFYLYGDGQSARALLPQLRHAIARGDSIFNLSGGEQLRDYLPVTEAAQLIVALIVKQQDIGVVNICSGQPISVRRLVERWARENGWSIDLNFGHHPYPEHEPMAFWGDAFKLNTLLSPRT